jgi:hypothetical protein
VSVFLNRTAFCVISVALCVSRPVMRDHAHSSVARFPLLQLGSSRAVRTPPTSILRASAG